MISVRKGAISFAIVLLFVAPVQAQPLNPPPGATMIQEVQAGGAQVYACRASATSGFAWTLLGPKAVLVNDDGSDFGTHSAGPKWSANDGSSITADGAHPVSRQARPNAVPGLVLTVTSTTGPGILSGARFVVRSDTAGGLPPSSGCDAAHENATVASHYSAIYTFYR